MLSDHRMSFGAPCKNCIGHRFNELNCMYACAPADLNVSSAQLLFMIADSYQTISTVTPFVHEEVFEYSFVNVWLHI